MAMSSTLEAWANSGYGPFSVRRDGESFVITFENADVDAVLDRGAVCLSRTVPVAWPESDGDHAQVDMRIEVTLHQLSLVRDDVVTISADRATSTASARLWVDAKAPAQQLASAVRTTALLAELAAAAVADLGRAITAEATIKAITEAMLPRERTAEEAAPIGPQHVATPTIAAEATPTGPPHIATAIHAADAAPTGPPRVATPVPSAEPTPGPTPTPPTAPAPPWQPTHVIPAGGLPSWPLPDPSTRSTPIDAGVEVQVTERNGPWAHIACNNGWAAWLDGTRLVPR
jgi:hypothetical protein